MGLTAIVLGAAAGGGFPQWNCSCEVCRLAWAGDKRVRARTQASLAVSSDGERWALINASPDLRAQIQGNPRLQPHGRPRGSPIDAVILTGAEIDQIAGLLVCASAHRSPSSRPQPRSRPSPAIRCSARSPPMSCRAAPSRPVRRFRLGGGLKAELFIVPGKLPLYLEGDDPDTASETAANVGVEISDGGKRLVYVPGAAAMTSSVRERLSRADALLFDGTVFTDDELIRTGTGTKTGRRMGHMPIEGEGGSLAALSGLASRRIFVHINNTNPILVDGSPERRRVEAAGWEVAEDGLEIVL